MRGHPHLSGMNFWVYAELIIMNTNIWKLKYNTSSCIPAIVNLKAGILCVK